MRRPHALVFLLAVGAGACQLLVGDDDRHLRDDGPDAAGPEADGRAPGEGSAGDGSSTSDGPNDGGPNDATVDAKRWSVVVLADHRTLPSGILTLRLNSNQQDYVYWIEESTSDAGSLWRVIDEAVLATPDLLVNAANPRAIGFESGFGIYFTDDTRPVAHLRHISVAPGGFQADFDQDLAGRSFEALSVASPYGFTEAVEPGDAGASIRRTNIEQPDGSPDCFTYTSASPTAFPVIVSDLNSVYFADTATNSILRVPRGCNQIPVTFAANQKVLAMTHDNSHVYWTTADGHVRSRDKAMSMGNQTYDASLVNPSGIATFDAAVYVADETTGIVYEITTPAGPTIIATGQGGPRSIMIGYDGKLYWSNRASGEIVGARPPNADAGH